MPEGNGRKDLQEFARVLVKAGVDVVVVDTAHGHSQGVLDRVPEEERFFASPQ